MLTRKQHLAMASVLKKAKKRLAKHLHEYKYKEEFVCTALSSLKITNNLDEYEAIGLTKEWINDQLGSGYTFECWLTLMGIKHDFKIFGFDKVQEYRHAWVDHMIKVLKS